MVCEDVFYNNPENFVKIAAGKKLRNFAKGNFSSHLTSGKSVVDLVPVPALFFRFKPRDFKNRMVGEIGKKCVEK